MLSILILLTSWTSVIQGQRTPTISYVTPNISTTRSSTIDMDCSVLWATEYPILWMKIDEDGKPIPLASGSSLIIRDHRYSRLAKSYTTTFTTQFRRVFIDYAFSKIKHLEIFYLGLP